MSIGFIYPDGGIGRRGRFKTCSSGEGSSPSWGTMKEKYFEWIKTWEQVPEDSERVLIKRYDWPEWEVAVWNDHYKSWDDAEGDDYFCDMNDVERWMRIRL